MKPRLLDLFCGAGGCTKGYQRAGFYVVGVDHVDQPNYCGDAFQQEDALEYLASLLEWPGSLSFDAIHASPPCQAFTAYRRTGNVGEYPDLVAQTRELLKATGLPYVIENVAGAPLENPVRLCGSGFGLDVERHRLFETNFPLMSPGCAHGRNAPDRFPGGRSVERTGSSRGLVRATVEVGSWDIPLPVQMRAMGIDWMTLEELSEAIPPAYTEHIGSYLMAEVIRRGAGGGVTRKQIRRDWRVARGKVDDEGRCRVCKGKGMNLYLQAAHVIGREHDVSHEDAGLQPQPGYDLYVRPESVIPLCQICHADYDRHAIDILHVLSLDEQLQAVRDAGSVESMRRRTAPTAYRPVPKGRAA